jgi:hypothetical protein
LDAILVYIAPRMNRNVFYDAMLSRDDRFDGEFFVGGKTTGIYCRPICPAKAKCENVDLFLSAQQRLKTPDTGHAFDVGRKAHRSRPLGLAYPPLCSGLLESLLPKDTSIQTKRRLQNNLELRRDICADCSYKKWDAPPNRSPITTEFILPANQSSSRTYP